MPGIKRGCMQSRPETEAQTYMYNSRPRLVHGCYKDEMNVQCNNHNNNASNNNGKDEW